MREINRISRSFCDSTKREVGGGGQKCAISRENAVRCAQTPLKRLEKSAKRSASMLILIETERIYAGTDHKVTAATHDWGNESARLGLSIKERRRSWLF